MEVRAKAARETLSTRSLDEVRSIVLAGLKGRRARVYLFGSWAAGTAVRSSDIDVGILPEDPIPPVVLSGIREALEESGTLYPVDLIDLSETPETFRERVMREGKLWTDSGNAWP